MPVLPDLKFEIIYDAEPYSIKFAPIGWDKLNKAGELDDFYLTVYEKINSELRFVYDGADLLRRIMYSKGANAKALVRISKRDVITNEYKIRIRQNVDFQKFSDINGVVTVGFLEKSVTANIRTYSDVQYSIPVGDNAIAMNIGGIGVDELVRWVGGGVEMDVAGTGDVFAPSLDIIENTTSDDIVEVLSNYNEYTGPLSDLDYPDDFAIKNVSLNPILARFKGSAQVRSGGAFPPYTVDFFIYDTDGNKYYLNENIVLVDDPDSDVKIAYGEFDINITMQPGVKYTFVVNPPPALGSQFLDSVDLSISYQTYTTDYTVKGLRAIDLYKALLGKMNPNSNLTISAPVLESGLGNRIVIAGGDNVRGIEGAAIQTSFREFMETFKPQLFCSQIINEDESIKLDVFGEIQYNKDKFCGTLGTVKDANYQSITEDYAGGIKVGYPDNSYDTNNGKDETNTEVYRTVQDSLAVNTIELISTYRADPRGVDQLLIQYRTDKTKDNTGDKQNFQFVINEEPNEEDGLYHLTGPEAFKEVTGTSALGRIYNLELAPIFMFLRNSARIAVQFAIEKIGTVNFQSSKKNAELRMVKFDDTVISEKMSVSYDQMNPPLYLPIKCTFTAIMTDDKYDAIIGSVTSRGGYITYVDRGLTIKAFLVAYSYNLTQNNIKEFTVYLHPKTDLTKLFNLK